MLSHPVWNQQHPAVIYRMVKQGYRYVAFPTIPAEYCQIGKNGFGFPDIVYCPRIIKADNYIFSPYRAVKDVHRTVFYFYTKVRNIFMKSNLRNEIKSYIVRAGCTMQEIVDVLSDEYGWSDSVSNLSNKLQRESLRYMEAVQLADVLGYDLVWQKRKDR